MKQLMTYIRSCKDYPYCDGILSADDPKGMYCGIMCKIHIDLIDDQNHYDYISKQVSNITDKYSVNYIINEGYPDWCPLEDYNG